MKITGTRLGVALILLSCASCSRKEQESTEKTVPTPPSAASAPRARSEEGTASQALHEQPMKPAAPSPSDTNAPSDVAAPPTDAQRTASGLASKVLKPGTGTKHPAATSRVEVHYTGWTTDGKMFDSSVTRGQPATFPLNAVIAGWTEGLQLMVAGEKRRLWIPESLAYRGMPGRPQGMLVFDVELLRILD